MGELAHSAAAANDTVERNRIKRTSLAAGLLFMDFLWNEFDCIDTGHESNDEGLFRRAFCSCSLRVGWQDFRPMKLYLILIVAMSALGIHAAQSLPAVPRFDGLGKHHHPVTTKWQLAQRYFDQGLTLCYNFNHAEAIRSFEAAAM